MKIEGFLKCQSVNVLIATNSTNIMASKVAKRLAHRIERNDKFEIKVPDGRILT